MSDKKQISTSNIKKALKESRSKKSTAPETEEKTESTTTESEAPAAESKRKRLTDEERAQRDADRKKERDEKKAQRDADRAAKKAAKEAEKASKIPHMAKVDKQAKNLPALAKGAQSLVTDVLNRFDEAGITSIVAHLQHELRRKATERALKVELEEGQLVRIVSADGNNSKWVGHLAHVLTAQRIRCYVQPVGTDKKVYLFSSNVKPLTEDEIKAVSSATKRPAAKTA